MRGVQEDGESSTGIGALRPPAKIGRDEVPVPDLGSLRLRAARGLLWSGSAQIIRHLLQIAFTAILARALAPSDFGRMAMIGVVTGLLSLLGEWGLGPALIQRREVRSAHLAAAFWGSFAISLVLMLALLVGAPGVSALYADAALKPLMSALALNFPAIALATVPLALLQRELLLARFALVEIVSLLIGGGVAVALALQGAGVWSLVGQTLATSVATVILAWPMAPVRLRDVLRGTLREIPSEVGAPHAISGRVGTSGGIAEAWRDLLRFGRPLVGINILTHIARNADNALIGRFLGAHALGYYALAYRLMLFPLQNISWVLGRALFPALSRVPEVARVRTEYRRAISGIALLAFPMMVGMALLAPELIRVLYGPQWERAIFPARVLCLVGALQAIGTTIGPLCLARGRPDVLLRWNLMATPLVGAAFLVGVRWGIEGVALAYASTSAALWYASHALANRLIHLPMRSFLRALDPAARATLVMVIAVLLLRHGLERVGVNVALRLTLSVSFGALVYGLALGALAPGTLRRAYDFARLLVGTSESPRDLRPREGTSSASAPEERA